ncbi:MAG TPA: fluoride efflux transporter CrcB [Solirubrobacteraceae bacterium]|nr:fluoride efflux transporter CrcB [Solirubrobacteraceae bacterium]
MGTIDRRELAAIFAGGMLGALARVELSDLFPSAPTQWPWAIFAINLGGAFLLGYLVTRLQDRLPISSYPRPFAGTGFCGAFTTFSTLQLEVLHMLEHHADGLAAGYCAASVAGGYLAVVLATALVRRVRVIA